MYLLLHSDTDDDHESQRSVTDIDQPVDYITIRQSLQAVLKVFIRQLIV